MAETSIAAVTRAAAYSPNNIGNDAVILNAVAVRLREQGCEVRVISESEFLRQDPEEETILNMCRERASIRKLMQLEQEGRLVINSGTGIANCTRERMTRILLESGIPHPDSIMACTGDDIRAALGQAQFGACWVKRADFHAVHKEDVAYCSDPEEAQRVVDQCNHRGIARVVVNRHLEGDLVKFYGVKGQPFFHWFYPFDAGHSKYGLETVNGKSQGLPFDAEALHAMCGKAAGLIGVDIYGGDCIVARDGTVRIIDFNDWPSFAPCREEAAVHIARCVMDAIKRKENEKKK